MHRAGWCYRPMMMNDFPASLRHPANRVDSGSQYTDDIEGYLFDGADGSQVAFWTTRADRTSKEHRHPYDEYMLVVAGSCVLHMEGQAFEMGPGSEVTIASRVSHWLTSAAGTRTIHHFGGHRAERQRQPR